MQKAEEENASQKTSYLAKLSCFGSAGWGIPGNLIPPNTTDHGVHIVQNLYLYLSLNVDLFLKN